MPAITYADFSGGLDRRLPITVQDASRLWTLRNAYITMGKRIAKRPGLRKLSGTLTGTAGLRAMDGGLVTWALTGASLGDLPANVSVQYLTPHLSEMPSSQLDAVHYAEMFQGYPYVVASVSAVIDGHRTPTVRHHYLDGSASTIITDAPQTKAVTKAASRVFAISNDGQTVKYCAVGAARDWTTSSDAGFLPTGLQQDTRSPATGIGTFSDSLAVFFPEAIQLWGVAVDPSANALTKRIHGNGSLYANSLAGFANDLVFLSSAGFRSMTVASQTDRIDDTDMGVPIDPLVRADLELVDRDSLGPKALWLPALGQYWCLMRMGTYTKAWVYSYSKSSKLSCWSEYTFPGLLTDMATVGGKVYARSADDLYQVDATQFTDNGAAVEVTAQMAFQDAKLPGVSKQFYGADMVVQGASSLAFLFDPRDTAKQSIAQQVSGDTRPGDMIPVELVSTSIAPVFTHSADEYFELDAVTLYYNSLGTI